MFIKPGQFLKKATAPAPKSAAPIKEAAVKRMLEKIDWEKIQEKAREGAAEEAESYARARSLSNTRIDRR